MSYVFNIYLYIVYSKILGNSNQLSHIVYEIEIK